MEDPTDESGGLNNVARHLFVSINKFRGLYPFLVRSLGTIVTITFHDHTQFRVPQKPQIIALTQTSKEAVVEALSHRCADFKNALEFKIEYEEYLRSLESQG
jgi:hypothetical protein